MLPVTGAESLFCADRRLLAGQKTPVAPMPAPLAPSGLPVCDGTLIFSALYGAKQQVNEENSAAA